MWRFRGSILMVVGVLWFLLGIGSIAAMPWGDANDRDMQAVLGIGLMINGFVFVLPGIVVAGIGASMNNKAKRAHARDVASAARATAETPEARLRRLDLLRSTGAITDAEHQAQRAEIVQSL